MDQRNDQRDVITEPNGFAIGYARGKGTFRVYITTALALAFGAVAFTTGSRIALVLAATFAVMAFYFFPLIEEGKARLGANQYGIFIEGFGLISWRGIRDVKVATRAIRSITVHELHIHLSRPITEAVIADWRQTMPYYRLLMRLPWKMPSDEVISIDLEPFESGPEEIVRQFKRRQSYFGYV
jgi:hypothetical protein